ALAHLEDLVGMAARGAAAQVRHAQIARIHEPDERRRFVIKQRVRPNRIARASPGLGEPGPDVRMMLIGGLGIAAMAIHATEPDRRGFAMWLVLSLVAGDTPRALGGGLLRSLPREVNALELGGERERRRYRLHHWPCRPRQWRRRHR